jgi:hypothetical protein
VVVLIIIDGSAHIVRGVDGNGFLFEKRSAPFEML